MTIESDADLLAALRTRSMLRAALDNAEHAVELAQARALLGKPLDKESVAAANEATRNIRRRASDIRMDLLALDDAIADAALLHLMHPPPERNEIAILPPASRSDDAVSRKTHNNRRDFR